LIFPPFSRLAIFLQGWKKTPNLARRIAILLEFL